MNNTLAIPVIYVQPFCPIVEGSTSGGSLPE